MTTTPVRCIERQRRILREQRQPFSREEGELNAVTAPSRPPTYSAMAKLRLRSLTENFNGPAQWSPRWISKPVEKPSAISSTSHLRRGRRGGNQLLRLDGTTWTAPVDGSAVARERIGPSTTSI